MRGRFRTLGVVATALALVSGTPRLVGANGAPVLLQAEPSPKAALKKAPREVRLVFNVELQPTSRVRVHDRSGRWVDRGPGGLDPADKLRRTLRVQLRPLGPGRYTVRWRAVIYDFDHGHEDVHTGAYDFTVKK